MSVDGEQAVTIRAAGLGLEGMFSHPGTGKAPVVLCAPHPQRGGTMDNEVVVNVAQAFSFRKHPVLRFNYRGVGRSAGVSCGGYEEVEDLHVAVDYALRETGADHAIVCGYSFGAWLAHKCRQQREDCFPIVLVSPPNKIMEFAFPLKGSDIFVITGDKDDYVNLDLILKHCPGSVLVVKDADHFFSKGMSELVRDVYNLSL